MIMSQIPLAFKKDQLLALAQGLAKYPKLIWSALWQHLTPHCIQLSHSKGLGRSIKSSMKTAGRFYCLQYLLLTAVARQCCLMGSTSADQQSRVSYLNVNSSLSGSQLTLACAHAITTQF